VIEACLYAVQRPAATCASPGRVHPGLYVLGDEVELARVLSNLLENARRYGKTPETGIAACDIAATARGEWVLLKVRDHGMGVSPSAAQPVKPFFRGDAARTAATGAGLGLAIVDKTVQRMGGDFCAGQQPQRRARDPAWRRTSSCKRPEAAESRRPASRWVSACS
jgi:two-component system osmolarity sensor histidine kinase EnvZ